MGSNMEIFDIRVLEIFPQNPYFKYSMLEPIQDNDNYKPHAQNYSNLFMFIEVIA
jgi:hypothetical protein